MKKLFTSILLVLALLGCKKNDTVTPSTATAVYLNVPAPYVIKEDFEMGTKAAYAIGPVTIKTGIWSFDDALLGKLATDIKTAPNLLDLEQEKLK